MSVDVKAIIGHKMSLRELVQFPQKIDSWASEIADLKQETPYPSKWDCAYQMDGFILSSILKDWERNTNYVAEKFCDNKISCFFGWIDVYRNTLVVTLSEHRYTNLCVPETAKLIIKINRIIAKNLEQSKIVYIADGSYPTGCLYDYAQIGNSIEIIIDKGIASFGMPPSPLSEGFEYMFFIDDVTTDIGELREWSPLSEKYWSYRKGEYELILR